MKYKTKLLMSIDKTKAWLLARQMREKEEKQTVNKQLYRLILPDPNE